MARLNVAERKDGINRASVRVEFDVSRRDLVSAALWHLETHYGELARRQVCTTVVGNLTRAKVLDSLRRGLQVRGRDMLEVAGENVARGTLPLVGKRIAVLFREFD